MFSASSNEGPRIINLSFDKKIAPVTGAAVGIGLAAARKFAEAGATAVLSDRDADAPHLAVNEMTSAGHRVPGVNASCAVVSSRSTPCAPDKKFLI